MDDYSDFDDARTWQLAASWRLVPALKLRGSVGTGSKAPTFTERFGFFADLFSGNLNLNINYNGSQLDNFFPPPFFALEQVELGRYTVVRLAASWKLTTGIELVGRISNLFDEDYEETSGFAGPAGVFTPACVAACSVEGSAMDTAAIVIPGSPTLFK